MPNSQNSDKELESVHAVFATLQGRGNVGVPHRIPNLADTDRSINPIADSEDSSDLARMLYLSSESQFGGYYS